MAHYHKQTNRRQFLKLAAGCSLLSACSVAGISTGQNDITRNQVVTKIGGRKDYRMFSPAKIGRLNLKNRMIRSAAYENGGTYYGYVRDAFIDIHHRYAEGGVGLTITGYMAVMPYGKKFTHVAAFDDSYIPGLKKVADAVHDVGNGCLIAAEIGHDGTGNLRKREIARIGPSGINWKGWRGAKVMSEADVDQFCTDMAKAAERLKAAGFDAVELHGAHHYLINTFLSPFTNRRTDKYGGSIQKRVRIVREIVEKTRKRVGADFPILIKLNCNDGPDDNGTEGEINLETFPKLVREIVNTGVDAIDISGTERYWDPLRMNIDRPQDQSFYRRYADALNEDIPIILGCGNRNVELLEGIVQQEKVDFFCFARPLVREPDLPKRWLEGRGPETAACQNTNVCFVSLRDGKPVHCRTVENAIYSQKNEMGFWDGVYGV